MSNVLLKINKSVPTTIFELPVIQVRINKLFIEMNGTIKERFDEIKNFITQKEGDEYSNISYEEIVDLFKLYFYKSVLNEVLELTFTKITENDKYDVIENTLEVLSEEKLTNAIMGKPMIDAFSTAISNLPNEGALHACCHGSKILLLEKEFLDKSIFD